MRKLQVKENKEMTWEHKFELSFDPKGDTFNNCAICDHSLEDHIIHGCMVCMNQQENEEKQISMNQQEN